MENKRTPAQVRRFSLITVGVMLLPALLGWAGMFLHLTIPAPTLVCGFFAFCILAALRVRFNEVVEGYRPFRRWFPAHWYVILILSFLVWLPRYFTEGNTFDFSMFHIFTWLALLSTIWLSDALLVLRKLSTAQEQ
jgi:hypothetical protein